MGALSIVSGQEGNSSDRLGDQRNDQVQRCAQLISLLDPDDIKWWPTYANALRIRGVSLVINLVITVDDAGNMHLYGTDSESGRIDFTSGWLSVFYPTGNPFSAAVQSPTNALFACNCLPGEDDGGWPGGGGGGGGPGPILP